MEDEPKKVGKDSGVGGGSGVVSVCWSRSAASSKKVPVDETNILVKKIVLTSTVCINASSKPLAISTSMAFWKSGSQTKD